MHIERARFSSQLLLLLPLSLLTTAHIQPGPSALYPRSDEPVPGGPLNNPAYLPIQIGGIVGAYAVSLVLVAITLLALSKKRRHHLAAGNDEVDFAVRKDITSPDFAPPDVPGFLNINTNVPNIESFLESSPSKSDLTNSPACTIGAPGVNPFVDQRVVAADRVTAQSRLEDMYKHVMEQEDAKKRGLVYEVPNMPGAVHQPPQSTRSAVASPQPFSPLSASYKKGRNKPATLNLDRSKDDGEKTQSRTSSLFSALRSPKKKAMKGVSISSPIMTPQSATFPRHESQEMNTIAPRQYAPAPPPPVPYGQIPLSAPPTRTQAPPLTPDVSPESVQSIDERIGNQLPAAGYHNRNISEAPTEHEPQSAASEHSQTPLTGLPTSPKPGARFPALPASPKPGATFQRSNAPSAVRTGGSLPLRAYEPAMLSPNTIGQTTKQTVFERRGPLSPSGAMTPHTAGAVPYSPYQPFTPCMPMTPSLVTRDERKRMKRLVPKTPTMDLVSSSDDIW